MPTQHDGWPGSYGLKPTILKCQECGREYETRNPRSSIRCPECRKKAVVRSQQRQTKKRNEKRRSAHA
jgi:DNA-directed RNA polymerase subunit RPC12/RpoP